MVLDNWISSINEPSTWFIAIVVLGFSIIYHYLNNRDLPPGPTGLPYFGYWPFLKPSSSHLQLQELGKKYGDVFSFTATGQLYINIGSIKANKEAFITKSEYFSERTGKYSLATRLFQGSVIFLNGEAWKANRKFFLNQFRERGLSNIKSGPMYDVIQETIENLRAKNGEPVDIIQLLTEKCSDILFRTCFGDKGISEQEMKNLLGSYMKAMENLNGPNMLPIGTFAKYFVLPFMPTYRNIVQTICAMENKLQRIIDRHRETFNEDNERNIIDAYIKEEKRRQSKNDPTSEYFTDNILVGSLIQFIGDGTLSVAGFIAALFGTLHQHPDEQEKIYKELMEVIGSDRDPTIEDKIKLRYTNAFISEMMRTSNAFPWFPKMECTRDVILKGYRIPKGAMTLMNIWSSHYDHEVFDDPEKFDPSRYLNEDGKKKPEQPILFGIGKRSCLGEGFTMAEIFLFMTTIVKHFHLSTPTKTAENNFLFFSGDLKICAQPRKE